MQNQLPVQPTPPSLLSIGKEPESARTRDIVDDSFREELTEVITNVTAPSDNQPTKDSESTPNNKSEDDSDHPISESKNERPAKEDSSEEATSSSSESKEVNPSTSSDENSSEVDNHEVANNLSEVVLDEITSSDAEALVDTEVSVEEIASTNIEVAQASLNSEEGTEQTTADDDVAIAEGVTLEQNNSEADIDQSLIDESFVTDEESNPDSSNSGDLEITDEVINDEVINETDAEEISKVQATVPVVKNTNNSSETNSTKLNEISKKDLASEAINSTKTTESKASSEEGLNKPIQAPSSQNFASELAADIDGTADVDTVDEGASNETNNQNATTERQAEKLSESRSVRQVDTGAPRVDPSRFVSRVTKAFESAQQKGGPIEIRLSPPELGSLQVRLEVKEGILTASMETENQAARNAILDNLPALRERLAEQQIRIEKFDVDVRDDSNPSDNWQQSEQQGDREAQTDRDRHTPLPDANQDSETNETNQTVSTIQLPNNGINLVA